MLELSRRKAPRQHARTHSVAPPQHASDTERLKGSRSRAASATRPSDRCWDMGDFACCYDFDYDARSADKVSRIRFSLPQDADAIYFDMWDFGRDDRLYYRCRCIRDQHAI
jgi:hypothetical protein